MVLKRFLKIKLRFYKLIGSSLLFVHDSSHANIWMIDFGKTKVLPKQTSINHDSQWIAGNYEDGYLIGIKSLMQIFNDLIVENS